MSDLRSFITGSSGSSWLRRLALLVLCALALWPAAAGIDLTLEDGYYYLGIARHLARGEGSTFDGLHPTNGYHPLWLLVLSGAVALTDTVTDTLPAALRIAHLVQGLLVLAGMVVLERTVRRRAGPWGGVVAVLAWTVLTHRLWWSGLELALQTLALAAVLALDLEGGTSARRDRLLALCLALLVLIRLETVLLVAVWTLVRSFGRPSARRVLWIAAPAAATFLAYLAVNQAVFASPWPVSATVKGMWSAELLAADPVYRQYGRLAAELRELIVPLVGHAAEAPLLPLSAGLAAAALWSALAVRDASLRPLAPWMFYGVLHYLALTLLQHGSLRFSPWYWVAQPMTAAVLLGLLAGRLPRRAGAVLTVAGLALAVLLVVQLGREARRPAFAPMRTAAAWIRDHLPETARIGAWNAGTLGVLSERRVINLDGLVNTPDFSRDHREDLCGYFQDRGITHVADVFRGDEAVAPVPTLPSYAACRDRFELLWEDGSFDPAWSLKVYRLRPSR